MTTEQKLERKLRKFMSGTVMYKTNINSTSAITFYAAEKEIKTLTRYILRLFGGGDKT